MKDIEITVIMPVYNGEKYIALSIKSILSQSFKNFEFIIIDDGSNDNTLQIIEKFSFIDKRIILIKNQHEGIAKAINKGLSLSKGKFIARMDSDDYSYPERLESQINFLKKNKETILIGSNYYLNYSYLKIKKISLNNSNACKLALIFFNPFAHPTIFFNKSLINTIGMYNENNKYSEDYDYWSRIAFKYKVNNINNFNLSYRITNQQITKKNNFDDIVEEIFNIQNTYLRNNDIQLDIDEQKNHKILLKLENFTKFEMELSKILQIEKYLIKLKNKLVKNFSSKIILDLLIERQWFLICLNYAFCGLNTFKQLYKSNLITNKKNLFFILLFLFALLRIRNSFFLKITFFLFNNNLNRKLNNSSS